MIRLYAIQIANLICSCYFLLIAITETAFGLEHDIVHNNSMRAMWLAFIIWPGVYFSVIRQYKNNGFGDWK